MIEYSVVLKRFPGSSRHDVVIFRDEDRKKVLKAMKQYSDKNGFTVYDKDGRFTIEDIVLVEKEPIYGSPVISETSYIELFKY